MIGLTAKQQQFVLEYLKDFNGAEAARRAGYEGKWAGEKAYSLLKDPKIQGYLAEKRKQDEEECDISRQAWLNELKVVAFSNMKDYVDIGEGGIIEAKAWNEIDLDKSRAVKRIKERRKVLEAPDGKMAILEVQFDYELHGKLEALKQIGEALGYDKPKGHVTAEMMGKVTVEFIKPDDLPSAS